MEKIDRRRFLVRLVNALSAVSVSGCDALSQSERFVQLLETAEGVNRRTHRAITPSRAMAREYDESEISAVFPTNGTTFPDDPVYRELAANGFVDWRLQVGGLVRRPESLSLAEIRQLPARTQITRHDCVEGWSAIAKWTGVPLSVLLDRVQPLPEARYVVFRCADPMNKTSFKYYESIDFEDALHPQTILAYELNDQPLPIQNGAPIRLRVERQLGYKSAKYIMRIELVDDLTPIGSGRGGYWEDQGYEWYAGI